MFFHHCFFRCFHFWPLIFTAAFRVFSLLIAYFYVTNFTAFLLGTLFLCCCTARAKDLGELFLLSGVFYLTLLPRICHSTSSATDLREIFLLLGISYLTVLPEIWDNLLLLRLSWEPAVLS